MSISSALSAMTVVSLLLFVVFKGTPNNVSTLAVILTTGFGSWGINVLNIWPTIFGVMIYGLVKKEKLGTLVNAMLFSTGIAPIITELLVRYPGIEVIGFGAFEESNLTKIEFLANANILSFGYRALLFHEVNMHLPVLTQNDAYGLVGLTIAEFRHAIKLRLRRLCGNPVKARHFARFRIEGSFVAMRYIEDIVLQILPYDEPSATIFLAFDTTQFQAFTLTDCVTDDAFVSTKHVAI